MTYLFPFATQRSRIRFSPDVISTHCRNPEALYIRTTEDASYLLLTDSYSETKITNSPLTAQNRNCANIWPFAARAWQRLPTTGACSQMEEISAPTPAEYIRLRYSQVSYRSPPTWLPIKKKEAFKGLMNQHMEENMISSGLQVMIVSVCALTGTSVVHPKKRDPKYSWIATVEEAPTPG